MGSEGRIHGDNELELSARTSFVGFCPKYQGNRENKATRFVQGVLFEDERVEEGGRKGEEGGTRRRKERGAEV